jgi:hypothetical protein
MMRDLANLSSIDRDMISPWHPGNAATGDEHVVHSDAGDYSNLDSMDLHAELS